MVPIPGTTKQRRLEENTGSVEVELSGTDLNVINTVLASIKIVGSRLPEAALKMTGR